jgi:hypothetical protein
MYVQILILIEIQIYKLEQMIQIVRHLDIK